MILPIRILVLSFKVEKSFGINVLKGDTLTIATPASSAACGVDYPLGTEVVVFADLHFSCKQPPDLLWTFLMSDNVPKPTRSQLDSLYGIPPVGVNHPGPRAKASPTANYGWRGVGGMTFALGNGSAGNWCSADGRVLVK